MEHVRVGGVRIAVRRAGTRGAPGLLLLHGAFGDGREWSRQLDDLAEDLDLVAWDAPGSGASDDPSAGWGERAFARCLAELIGRLGLHRPTVCGLSLGAVEALLLVRHHPEVVGSLVLASPYAGWAGSLPRAEVEARIAMVRATLERPVDAWVDDFLATVFGPTATEADRQQARLAALETRPASTRMLLDFLADLDLRDVLPGIAVPTLLLHGSLDVRSSRAVVDTMHAEIPGSRLVVLDGVGHAIATEAPERFAGEVRRFLRSMPR